MEKPRIEIFNQDLYPWYVDFERNPKAVWLGHTLMSAVLPRMEFADGARQEIIDHRNDGGVFLVASSHQSFFDQFYAAAMTRKAPDVFGPLEGIARIPTKQGLFTKWDWLRAAIEQMGAYPVIRDKDIKKLLGNELTPYEEANLINNHIDFLQASIQMLDNGQDVFIYPQGTRDPQMSKMDKGVGKMAVGVFDQTNLAIIPMGLHYQRFKLLGKNNPFRATLFTGNLIKGPFDSAEETNEIVFDTLKYCVEMATERSPNLLYKK